MECLGRESDLRDEHEGIFSRLEGLLDDPQVDFGLPAARYAMKEEGMKRVLVEEGTDRVDGRFLLRGEARGRNRRKGLRDGRLRKGFLRPVFDEPLFCEILQGLPGPWQSLAQRLRGTGPLAVQMRDDAGFRLGQERDPLFQRRGGFGKGQADEALLDGAACLLPPEKLTPLDEPLLLQAFQPPLNGSTHFLLEGLDSHSAALSQVAQDVRLLPGEEEAVFQGQHALRQDPDRPVAPHVHRTRQGRAENLTDRTRDSTGRSIDRTGVPSTRKAVRRPGPKGPI